MRRPAPKGSFGRVRPIDLGEGRSARRTLRRRLSEVFLALHLELSPIEVPARWFDPDARPVAVLALGDATPALVRRA